MSDISLHFPDCLIHTMPQRSPEWHAMRKGKLTASQVGSWLAERPQCRLTIPEIKAQLDSIGEPYKSAENRERLLVSLESRIPNLPRTHLAGTVAARHTAICGILGAISGCEVPDQWEVDPNGDPPKNPALWAIWRGIREESNAVAAFEDATGESVYMVGFCEHRSTVVGCSPDGLIVGKAWGFEGKVPLPSTHCDYVLNNANLIKAYGDQCHFSMAVTGAEGWWLQSFCPPDKDGTKRIPDVRIAIHRDETTENMVAGIAEFAEALDAARDEIASLWDAEFQGSNA